MIYTPRKIFHPLIHHPNNHTDAFLVTLSNHDSFLFPAPKSGFPLILLSPEPWCQSLHCKMDLEQLTVAVSGSPNFFTLIPHLHLPIITLRLRFPAAVLLVENGVFESPFGCRGWSEGLHWASALLLKCCITRIFYLFQTFLDIVFLEVFSAWAEAIVFFGICVYLDRLDNRHGCCCSCYFAKHLGSRAYGSCRGRGS